MLRGGGGGHVSMEKGDGRGRKDLSGKVGRVHVVRAWEWGEDRWGGEDGYRLYLSHLGGEIRG